MAPRISCHVERDPAFDEDFLGEVRRLGHRSHLTDVQLQAADGGILRAHGTVLHVCSSLLSLAMCDVRPQGDHVIMLPDFSYESVSAMLQLIYTGECSIKGSYMKELHHMLSIVIDRWKMEILSTESAAPAPIPKYPDKKDAVKVEEEKKRTKPETPESEINQSITEQPIADESDEEFVELKNSSRVVRAKRSQGSKVKECQICNQSLSSVERLRAHVAMMHYIKQIREKCGIADSATTCPFCSKSFTRKSGLIVHLAYVHSIISEVEKDKESESILQNTLASRNQDVTKPGTQEDERDRPASEYESDEEELEFESSDDTIQAMESDSSMRDMCPICHQVFSSVSNARSHLATQHYGTKIREENNITKSTTNCPLCSKTSATSDCLVIHLAYAHKKISEVEANRDILEWFAPTTSRRVSKSSHLENGRDHTEEHNSEGESDEEFLELENSGKAVPTTNIKKQCPICDKYFPSPSEARQHAALQHYSEKIREKFDISSFTTTCPICSVSSSGKKRLITHLASIHNFAPTTSRRVSKSNLRANETDPTMTEDQHSEEESDEEFFELENSGNITQSTDSKEHCPLCNRAFTSKSDARRHVALTHYGKKIKERFKISSSTTTCPICSLSTWSNAILINHLASIHNAIGEIEENQDILKWMNAPSRKRKTAFTSPNQAKVLRTHLVSNGRRCPVCAEVASDDEARFRRHFIDHYKDKILASWGFGEECRKCPLCDFGGNDPGAIAVHAGLAHKEVRAAMGDKDLFKQVFGNIEPKPKTKLLLT